MSKDPAFLFYSNDFLAGTYTMDDSQVGRYIRLLCIQHQAGHLAEKQMLSICKSYDEDIWCKFQKDNDGLYFNVDLDLEIQRRQAHSLKQKENIAKRWNKSGTHVGNTMVLPLETGTVTITNTKSISNKDIDIYFNTIWSMYPRKEGKGSVSDTQKKKLFDIGLEEMTRAVDRYKAKIKQDGTEKKYVKQGSTFFNSGYLDYIDANYDGGDSNGVPGTNTKDTATSRWGNLGGLDCI